LQPPFSIRFFEISPFSASAIRKERGGNSGRNRHHEEKAMPESRLHYIAPYQSDSLFQLISFSHLHRLNLTT
jgi:hypothetical protein